MYKSLEELITAEKENNIPFWKCAMQKDCLELDITEAEAFARMKQMYLVMKEADRAYQAELISRSGLVGGDGQRMHKARVEGKLICGDFIGRVMERAIKMGESNACMKRIVAAPTAGSCGVIPAVFITVQEEFSFTDDKSKVGAPKDFTIFIRDIELKTGSGFIVAIAGDMMLMPGLSKIPNAEKIDILPDGTIVGLS